MHPILFKLPLPNFNLPYLWIPYIVAAIAALVGIAKMVGKEKDRSGALMAGGVAVVALIARFTVLKGSTDSFAMGNIPIYSYGVMLGLSLVVGWYLTLGLAERDGLPKETMANNYVVTAIAAVVGSRVLYILTNLNEFDTFASMFAMRRGGLVAYGGFLGGLAGSFFFLRRHKIPLLPWADVAVPSLASGLMITRIGCYLFGCDFGKPLSESAPGFLKKLGTFPHWAKGTLEAGDGAPAFVQHVTQGRISSSATASLPVHPTQIYESLVGAFLLAILLWARRKQKFRGEIFLIFFFGYGVLRYLLEIIRDDAERGSIPPSLPEHILVPFGLVLLGIGWAVGFARAVENVTLRRVTQVLAFAPALALYFALRPEKFGNDNNLMYSTSQAIAVASGVLASSAFVVLYKAAQAHPRQAMALNLPAEFAPAGAAPLETPAPADDDEEEAPVRRKTAKKTSKVKGKAKAKKAQARPKEDADDGEEERVPAKKKAESETEAKEEAPKAEAEAKEEAPKAEAEAKEEAPKASSTEDAAEEPVKAS